MKKEKTVKISDNGKASISRIVIPKIVHELKMESYAPSWQGQSMWVWVNPTMDVVKEGIRLSGLQADLNLKTLMNVQVISARDLLLGIRQASSEELVAQLFMYVPEPGEPDVDYAIRFEAFMNDMTPEAAKNKAYRVMDSHDLKLKGDKLPYDRDELGNDWNIWKSALYEWYADIWSQHDEFGVITGEEVMELAVATAETDPAFWAWLTSETQEMIKEHRDLRKK